MSCEHGPAVKCPDCDVESLHGLKAHLAGVKERSTKTAVHRDQLLEENKALRLRLAGVERDRKGHMETVELQHRALQEQQEKWSKLHEKCASVEVKATHYEYLLRSVGETYCKHSCPEDADNGGVHEATCQDVRTALGVSPKD